MLTICCLVGMCWDFSVIIISMGRKTETNWPDLWGLVSKYLSSHVPTLWKIWRHFTHFNKQTTGTMLLICDVISLQIFLEWTVSEILCIVSFDFLKMRFQYQISSYWNELKLLYFVSIKLIVLPKRNFPEATTVLNRKLAVNVLISICLHIQVVGRYFTHLNRTDELPY